MKKTFRAIVIAVAAVTALIACSKEAAPVEAGKMEKGKIGVSVSALMAELTPAEAGTKASVASVVRLTWENADAVSAFCGSEYLGQLNVSVSDDNKMVAKLSGELTAPTSGTTITLIHSNIEPTVSGSTVSVDFSDQKTVQNPFVVYGTLAYTETNITNQVVPFKFATSLMFVTVTGLDDTDVDCVMVSGINTVCQLTVQSNGEPTVAGTTKGTITTKVDESNRLGERAIFNIGIVKDGNTGRKISAVQKETTFEADFTTTELAASASYISVYALKEVIDFVVMNMGTGYEAYTLKWATKNLGATTVAGSGETCYGDYYAWGETEPYYTRTWNSTSKEWSYSWNTYKDAGYNWKSYCENDAFKELVPTPYDATNKILKDEKDVAKVQLGGNWRMPTEKEFQDLYAACVDGEYDPDTYGTDACGESTTIAQKGVYLCGNYDGVAGVLFYDGTHRLFFPAAGYGKSDDLEAQGEGGSYWSRTRNTYEEAQAVYFSLDEVDQPRSDDRCNGYSIRPVSDL